MASRMSKDQFVAARKEILESVQVIHNNPASTQMELRLAMSVYLLLSIVTNENNPE